MTSPLNGLAMIVLGSLFLVAATTRGGELDRTRRPAPRPAPKIELPEIQKKTLSNGLEIWLVERHELPMVAFNLVIQAGSDHDPLTKPGIAAMTADLIDEGTKTRDALQISEGFRALGTSLGVNSGWDGSFMTLSLLSKFVDKGLALFSDVLTNPTFPQKEFERIRKQRLTTLIQQRDQPVTIANVAFAHILYGSGHPYGNNPSGTEKSLGAMTVDDVKQYYQSYYRPNNAVLIVVGDARMDQLSSILEQSLAGWKKMEVPPYALPPAPQVGQTKVYLIDKPGAAQSEIRIGYPALARSTPDYFPVVVMNRLLGGQFTSRINLNLRERHGFTYGARSVFGFQKAPGPFVASAAVVTEKTDSSVQEFLHELRLMHDAGMSDEELAFVKKGVTGNFALTFETPSQVAGALQSLVLYGLPDNYFGSYLQNVDAVSRTDAGTVAQKYLDTSRMAIVVVGDLAKIRAGIEALHIGEVQICDLDGNPIQ